jgi:hypothetical protein
VLSDLNRRDVGEEGNLLIEAVSLLVQRQRETESWIAEQVGQAEERATAAERLYADLEVRLAGIEEHLARLVHDVEPLREDAGVDERLERLREQVEGLKSSADGRTARTNPVLAASTAGATHSQAVEPRPVGAREQPYTAEPRPLGMRPVAPARPRMAATSAQGASFWDLLGPSPQDRFGLVLIGAGLVAVVYAVLTQLRF